MSSLLSRIQSCKYAVARMSGHRAGYRLLNGTLGGMSPLEKDFRYRMHELCGAAEQAVLSKEDQSGLKLGQMELWKSIYGLHEFFGKSNRIDDLIGLLLMARKAWLREPPTVARLELLRDCLDAMAREQEPRTVDLMLDLGEKLEAAGVDLKAGF
jgi:hypothetical protein